MSEQPQFSEWTLTEADLILADIRSELQPDDDGTQFDRLLAESLMLFTRAEANQIIAVMNVRLAQETDR
jgi:hypothetical protein